MTTENFDHIEDSLSDGFAGVAAFFKGEQAQVPNPMKIPFPKLARKRLSEEEFHIWEEEVFFYNIGQKLAFYSIQGPAPKIEL